MYSIFDSISFPWTFVRSFTAFPSTQLNALLETKQITSLQSRKCMLHLHSVFNSFTCLGMCIFPSSILLKECDIWYSALVHKSSVRAFLLITFNLLKKTILSCKLFFVYSLELFALYPYTKFSLRYYDGIFLCARYLNCG